MEGALAGLLSRLAEEAGVETEYPKDEDGVVRLVFDDNFFLGMMESEENGLLLMWCPVAELPQDGVAKLAVELLKANHFGRATSGGTLSVSDEGVVFLQCQLPLPGTGYEAFRRRLEGMVAAAATWRQLVEECRDGVIDVQDALSRRVEKLRNEELGMLIKA